MGILAFYNALMCHLQYNGLCQLSCRIVETVTTRYTLFIQAVIRLWHGDLGAPVPRDDAASPRVELRLELGGGMVLHLVRG